MANERRQLTRADMAARLRARAIQLADEAANPVSDASWDFAPIGSFHEDLGITYQEVAQTAVQEQKRTMFN